MKEQARFGFGDRDFRVGRIGAEFGDAEVDKVGGFFFDGAFEIKVGFIGGPLKDAKTDAEAGDARRNTEVPDFEDFLVEKIGDEIAAGRDLDSAGVCFERGDFLVVLGE